jgi:divalent metal cation (Fe/Co/Zn/Cd) transporter
MSEAALPTRRHAPAAPRHEPSEDWLRAARRARALSWLSLVWMGAEGAIAITAGILAGSIALIGFGIDSAIEGAASLVIVWRFTGHRLLSHAAEQRAQKLVAVQFFLLAPYVAFEAVRHLATAHEAEISVLGMVLTATSLIGMPFLGIAKQRLAGTLGSSATHGEGAQNLLCAYLAGAVFLGLAGNALFGWWWLDPIAALLVAAVALREGVETWRGKGCCAAPELDPAAAARDECCSEAALPMHAGGEARRRSP